MLFFHPAIIHAWQVLSNYFVYDLLSPLRYPGSKKRLASLICDSLKANGLTPQLYVEPFVGGASVALNLLEEGLVEQVVLMDIDPLVASFWKAVFNDVDWLLEQIETIPITLEQWKYFKHSVPTDFRSQAMACLFLNRTSFSGILEPGAGPLGGMSQKSSYPIACRFPRRTLIDRILQITRYRERILGVWCCSWDAGIQHIRQAQLEGSLPNQHVFFYFDPPFFEKAERLYRFVFKHEDHVLLRNFILELDDPWLLSYDAADEFEELYGEAILQHTNGTHKQHFELLYTTARQQNPRIAREVILSNLPHLPEAPTLSG